MFIPSRNTWGNIGESIGRGAIEGYQERADEVALQKAVGELGPNASARQIIEAITKTRTYSPQSKQNLIKNYVGASQFEELQRQHKSEEEIKRAKNEIEGAKLRAAAENKTQERNKTQAIVDQLKIPAEQKKSLGESISLSSAEDLLKTQLKSEINPNDKIQQKIKEKQAEEYVEAVKSIPQLETTLQDIDHASKLASELGYFGGVTAPLSGLVGTSKAKELEAASFPLIQPIVKMFNPTGPIAQRKLELIESKYKMKATNFPWQNEAIAKALKRFATMALDRAKQRVALYEKYNDDPPEDVVKSFDKETETLSNVMEDYEVAGQEASPEEAPPVEPRLKKGKTLTAPNGRKYYSDGVRWLVK